MGGRNRSQIRVWLLAALQRIHEKTERLGGGGGGDGGVGVVLIPGTNYQVDGLWDISLAGEAPGTVTNGCSLAEKGNVQLPAGRQHR